MLVIVTNARRKFLLEIAWILLVAAFCVEARVRFTPTAKKLILDDRGAEHFNSRKWYVYRQHLSRKFFMH